MSAPSRSSRGPRIGALGIGICRGLDRAALVSEARVPALHPPHLSRMERGHLRAARCPPRPPVVHRGAGEVGEHSQATRLVGAGRQHGPRQEGPRARLGTDERVLLLIAGTQVEPTSPESPTACIGGWRRGHGFGLSAAVGSFQLCRANRSVARPFTWIDREAVTVGMMSQNETDSQGFPTAVVSPKCLRDNVGVNMAAHARRCCVGSADTDPHDPRRGQDG